MGLTIHYRLKAAGDDATARRLVTALHQAARDLPFKEVGPLIELSGPDCDYNRRDKANPLRWLLIQSQESVSLAHLPGEPQYSSCRVSPGRLFAFTAWPGEGCEEASFGLCQFPAEVIDPRHSRLKTGLDGWRWSSFCKTQYASDPQCGGVANFLRCHLTVIALLDHAKQLGCLAEVSDEGGFWEERNLEQLVQEIGSWNEMIAALGGRLRDLFRDGVKMPISEFPNFEQLEHVGQKKLPPGMDELARLIQRVVQKF